MRFFKRPFPPITPPPEAPWPVCTAFRAVSVAGAAAVVDPGSTDTSVVDFVMPKGRCSTEVVVLPTWSKKLGRGRLAGATDLSKLATVGVRVRRAIGQNSKALEEGERERYLDGTRVAHALAAMRSRIPVF